MVTLLLLLLAMLAPPDPGLLARQDGASAVTISWRQDSYGCLFREPAGGGGVLIACYQGSGRMAVQLGYSGPLDAAYHPAAGDIYRLDLDGASYRTPLRPPIYLPLTR